MDRTDEELIDEYRDGNTLAFKTLVDTYTPLLYNFVSRFVGSTNAPDVVQDIFIKIWRNIQKFDKKKSLFKTWTFTIARNTITDYLRKKKSVVFSDMDAPDEEDEFAESIADTSIDIEEDFDRVRDAEELNGILGEMPEHYKSVLLLYYQEEMTFAQIGEVLGKPLNTVKSHHRRALKHLRDRLKKDPSAPKL